MRYSSSFALPLFAAIALGACSQSIGEYPSLAKRPAERVTAIYGVPDAAPAQTPLAQPDAAVLGQIDSLLAQAGRGDARFRRGEPTAQRMVAQAGRARIGSEPWSLATMAVSELEAARGETMVPLAELDRLFAEAFTQGLDVTAIAKARGTVIAIVGRQDDVLSGLRQRLGN
ncbi:MAG: hypothetical protein ABL914_06450 [Novosphingobium sp.]|uniref:hypothetical protein n=1 Tax=Novosphingobium sp. TaxID=1874826 RepID=UPI0032B9C44E